LIQGEHGPVTTGARSVPGFLLLALIAEPIVRYLRGALDDRWCARVRIQGSIVFPW
jgi:hypothetical protein